MTNHPQFNLIAAAFHFLPAFVWWVIAWDLCRYAWRRRPTSHFFRMAPFLSILMALHFSIHIIIELTPTQLEGRLPRLHETLELGILFVAVGAAALFRHIIWLLPLREEEPSRAWLGIHYGFAALVCAFAVVLFVFRPNEMRMIPAFSGFYMFLMGFLSLWHMRQLARGSAWSARGLALLQIHPSDFLFSLGAMLAGSTLILIWVVGGAPTGRDHVDDMVALVGHTLFGLCFAIPFAARMLGRMIRVVMVWSWMTILAAMMYLGVPHLTASLASPELRRLAGVVAVLALTTLLISGREWLLAIADRKTRLVPFLRRWDLYPSLFLPRARAELDAFVSVLPPELGVAECCQRAVTTVVRVMHLRGAAALIPNLHIAAGHGTLDMEPLTSSWSTLPDDLLPARAYAGAELRELPMAVKEVLIVAGVVGVLPIASPRRRWGHLLIATRFLETATSDENVEALQSFANQLALVLDSAELLTRTVAVERSLAHAEKLAAIGELAARIAHEIRNPITAARSLAQQLAREPATPFHPEHALILEELERVERQVAALLRFARREEFRFEPVDLGELARATVDHFRARLEAAGVEVELEAPTGVVAAGDREKLRQVLINLVENALDALGDAAGRRRLALAVATSNGTATLRVADSGPGVPPDALPHLFEPFFSLKPTGTGLGLAIAKRTVEAHGGNIAARPAGDTGLRFDIELPVQR